MSKTIFAMASAAVLLVSGCFYSRTVKEVPAQSSQTYSTPGQTTTESTTTNDDGTVKHQTTTTYSNP